MRGSSRRTDALTDPITLVAGATLVVTDRHGDIDPDTWAGLYHHDVRVLSRLTVTLDGEAGALLSSHRDGASTSTVVTTLASSDGGDPTALLLRRWEIADGPRLVLEVRAFDRPIRAALLRIDLEADFVPAQKGAVERRPDPATWQVGSDALYAEHGAFAVRVQAVAARSESGALTFTVDAEPGRPWRTELRLMPWAQRDTGRSAPPAPVCDLAVETSTARWAASVSSALADLRGLHVDVPELDLRFLAAGAPWFMALFGRDTLISSWESLIAGTDTSLDVLRSLARYQGQGFDERTGEQPGRILHELRTGGAEVFGVSSGRPYYGTVDASPLFVMLLAEVHRWGASDADVRDLLPAARAAVHWCRTHGDLDGDGYVEYAADAGGLVNQGWKDSVDAMVHADGALAPSPIALAEVQAYLWAALTGLAELEERLGDACAAPGLREEADRLRAAFQRDFWLPEQRLVAMALDAGKRPLAVASSNTGHCLWAGILDEQVGGEAARRLSEPDLSAGWGLRTLGSREPAYNPLGYHLGTIWPHDTAIAVAGLRRYGHREAASQLTERLLAAAEAFQWRLPELFAGFGPEEVARPVPYPTACSPQAWSAAVPLLLLREVLGLDPDVPAGRVHLAPDLPGDVSLDVTGIPLGPDRLDVRVSGDGFEVLDAPDGLVVDTGRGRLRGFGDRAS